MWCVFPRGSKEEEEEGYWTTCDKMSQALHASCFCSHVPGASPNQKKTLRTSPVTSIDRSPPSCILVRETQIKSHKHKTHPLATLTPFPTPCHASSHSLSHDIVGKNKVGASWAREAAKESTKHGTRILRRFRLLVWRFQRAKERKA